jgi:hypothetical protein
MGGDGSSDGCSADLRPRCTPGLRLYQWMMDKNRRARRWNQQRLRELRQRHGGDIEIFSGHDPVEFERLAGRPLAVPLGARAPAAAVTRSSGPPRASKQPG